MLKYHNLALLATSILCLSYAQTFTEGGCDPITQADCPRLKAFPEGRLVTDFTKGDPLAAGWIQKNAGNITYDGNGANFIIQKQGDSPLLISSANLWFGSVEVVCKAASGQGIVNSIDIQGETRDELDWEGIGSRGGQIQTNFYSRGFAGKYDRGAFHDVSPPIDQAFHAYEIRWRPDVTQWLIDGRVVRTLSRTNAPAGPDGEPQYPQTPGQVRLALWAGGDKTANEEGTVNWAGGPVNWGQAPFVMTVKSVAVKNYSPAQWYEWNGAGGKQENVRPVNGKMMSNADAAVDAPPDAPPPKEQRSQQKDNQTPATATVAGPPPTTAAGPVTPKNTSAPAHPTTTSKASPTSGNFTKGGQPPETKAANAAIAGLSHLSTGALGVAVFGLLLLW